MATLKARALKTRWRRAVPALCLLLALAAALLAAQRGWTGWREARANRQMAAGEPPPTGLPRVLLARAIRLERDGRDDDALAAYAQAEALGDDALRQAARLNVSNLYLRRGIEIARADGDAQRALVLIQLAKSGYRRVLRVEPGDWDARYNLELAQHLLPDLEVRSWRQTGNETEVEDAPKKDRAAWTELVGQPRGMH